MTEKQKTRQKRSEYLLNKKFIEIFKEKSKKDEKTLAKP